MTCFLCWILSCTDIDSTAAKQCVSWWRRGEEKPADCFFITETTERLMSRYTGVNPLWKKVTDNQIIPGFGNIIKQPAEPHGEHKRRKWVSCSQVTHTTPWVAAASQLCPNNSYLFQQRGPQRDRSRESGSPARQLSPGSWSSCRQRWTQELTKNFRSWFGDNGPDVLSRFGADKHPEGLFAVETLPEENFHFRERPEEHHISVYCKQFLPHLQASRLWKNMREKKIFFSINYFDIKDDTFMWTKLCFDQMKKTLCIFFRE